MQPVFSVQNRRRVFVVSGALLGAVVLTLAVLAFRPQDSADPDALCPVIERLGAQRAADVTDGETIDELVAELPPQYRDEAALFYYPHAGSVPQNASGVEAQAAGEELYRLYEELCSYQGP